MCKNACKIASRNAPTRFKRPRTGRKASEWKDVEAMGTAKGKAQGARDWRTAALVEAFDALSDKWKDYALASVRGMREGEAKKKAEEAAMAKSIAEREAEREEYSKRVKAECRRLEKAEREAKQNGIKLVNMRREQRRIER